MLCHDNLANFYSINFLLNQDYHLSLTEIHEMLPYEREIFIQMIADRNKENGNNDNNKPDFKIPTKEEIEELRR